MGTLDSDTYTTTSRETDPEGNVLYCTPGAFKDLQDTKAFRSLPVPLLQHLLSSKDISDADFRLWMQLFLEAGLSDRLECTLPVAVLQHLLRKAAPTIRNSLSRLEKLGYIVKTYNFDIAGKGQLANTYGVRAPREVVDRIAKGTPDRKKVTRAQSSPADRIKALKAASRGQGGQPTLCGSRVGKSSSQYKKEEGEGLKIDNPNNNNNKFVYEIKTPAEGLKPSQVPVSMRARLVTMANVHSKNAVKIKAKPSFPYRSLQPKVAHMLKHKLNQEGYHGSAVDRLLAEAEFAAIRGKFSNRTQLHAANIFLMLVREQRWTTPKGFELCHGA